MPEGLCSLCPLFFSVTFDKLFIYIRAHKADCLLFQVFRLSGNFLFLGFNDFFASSGVAIPHILLNVFILKGIL